MTFADNKSGFGYLENLQFQSRLSEKEYQQTVLCSIIPHTNFRCLQFAGNKTNGAVTNYKIASQLIYHRKNGFRKT
jgi:hypothetical protein